MNSVLSWGHIKKGIDEDELKRFGLKLGRDFIDSMPFLESIRGYVARDAFYRKRKPNISKSIDGRFLGLSEVTFDQKKMLSVWESNRALLDTRDKLKILDLNLGWGDESLKNWAESKSNKCSKMYRKGCSIDEFKNIVESYGIEWMRKEHGLPPKQQDLFSDESAILRCCDVKWWIRKARVLKVRTIDQIARELRMVHALAQPYASNEAVKIRRSQSIRNRRILEGLEAVNQDGQSYTLAELSDLSVSNPQNRRNELMVRMRGFEELAARFGHEGLFVTMSCPSRFHPSRQYKNKKGRLVRVDRNENYLDESPRDAQAWMNKTWSLIRAEFARRDIRTYGFRVVEPHADGCPHWHQLLFFDVDNIKCVKSIFEKYCFRTDAEERGAKKHRLKIVSIDGNLGSATGYIAKYISKNIDGFGVDEDLIGGKAVEASKRIGAWASTWGIRQFQQIGGPSVTVWRELRRVENADGIIEEAREAADSSDWAAYCLVQGNDSPFVIRKYAPIKPAYWVTEEELCDSETGEIFEIVNKYNEVSKGKLFGLLDVFHGKYVLSRFYDWTIQRIGAAVKVIKKVLPVTVLSADELLDLLRGDGLGSTA